MKKIFILIFLGFFCACRYDNRDQKLFNIIQLEYNRNGEIEKWGRFLSDGDPWIRQRACLALGRIQDTTAIDPLRQLLKDPDDEVRREAAFALGQMWNSRAEDDLIQTVLDENKKEWNARTGSRIISFQKILIEALGKCGTEKSIPVLRKFLNKDFQTVSSAVLALGICAYRKMIDPAAVDDIIKLLEANMSEEIRWKSTYALFRISSPHTPIPPLIDALDDTSDLVRIYTLRTLSRLQNETMIGPITKKIYDRDWRVRVEVARTLGSFAKIGTSRKPGVDYFNSGEGEKIFKSLLSLLVDPSLHVRLSSIESLGLFKSKKTLPYVKELLKDTDWHVQSAALHAIAHIETNAALPILKKFAVRKEWHLRSQVASSLGDLNSPESLDLLLMLCNDSDSRVKASAIPSLENYTSPKILSGVQSALVSGDLALSASAADLVGRKKYRELSPSLVEGLSRSHSSTDTESMQSFITAMDSLGDPQFVPVLEKLLTDPDITVARKSAFVLQSITHKKYVAKPAQLDSVYRFDYLQSLGTNPSAEIITEKGKIVIQFFPLEAPATVMNFCQLAEKKYFDGLQFHRVVPNFVIQDGDPRGDGWGGPGYTIRCEYNHLKYDRGMVGMALAGKDTGGSQWFITHSPQPHLDGRYTIFAKVIEGMNIVDDIQVGTLIRSVKILK